MKAMSVTHSETSSRSPSDGHYCPSIGLSRPFYSRNVLLRSDSASRPYRFAVHLCSVCVRLNKIFGAKRSICARHFICERRSDSIRVQIAVCLASSV